MFYLTIDIISPHKLCSSFHLLKTNTPITKQTTGSANRYFSFLLKKRKVKGAYHPTMILVDSSIFPNENEVGSFLCVCVCVGGGGGGFVNGGNNRNQLLEICHSNHNSEDRWGYGVVQ